MIRYQDERIPAPHFYLRAFICIIAPIAICRALWVLHLYCAASDFASTFSVSLLRWGYLAFFCLSTAASYTLCAIAIYTAGPRGAAGIMGIYALRCLLDATAQFFIEKLSFAPEAQRSGYDDILSIVSLLSELFAAVALAFGVWIMASAFYRIYQLKDHSRKYALKNAINGAILIEFAVPFIRLVTRGFKEIFTSLNPSVALIRELVYGGIEIVVFHAIVAFVGSRVVLRICTRSKN